MFTGEAREQWGCIDDLVLQLQGEAMRENSGTHTALTVFREMIFNPDFRQRQLEKQQDEFKNIEVQDGSHHDRR